MHDGNHSGEELVSNVAIPDQMQKMLERISLLRLVSTDVEADVSKWHLELNRESLHCYPLSLKLALAGKKSQSSSCK